MTLLRDLRKQKRLTLAAVEAATGIDTGSLSRIERGEQFPNQVTATNLAAFFGISIGDVFDGLPVRCSIGDQTQRVSTKDTRRVSTKDAQRVSTKDAQRVSTKDTRRAVDNTAPDKVRQ